MSGLGNLNIQLNLDMVQYTNALNKSAHQAQKFVRSFDVNFANAENRLRSFSAHTSKYLKNIEKAANSINSNTNFALYSALGTGFGGGLNKLSEYTDSYTEINNKLRLVEGAGIDAAKGLQSVFDTQQTNSGMTRGGLIAPEMYLLVFKN